MRRSILLSALLALVAACSSVDAVAVDAGVADAVADRARSCARDARPLIVRDYYPTRRTPGACDPEQIFIFGDDCGPNPNATKCGTFLAANPTCARCLLGEVLPGPLRRGSDRLTEISPGACAQVLAGESYPAGFLLPVGGCGKTIENTGACVTFACAGCDASDLACRVAAYSGQCATDPNHAKCDAIGAAKCVLGSAVDRARAIAAAVCGGEAADAGTDAGIDGSTDAADDAP